MLTAPVSGTSRLASATTVAVLLAFSPLSAGQDAPVFRTTTDLIAVDVQVVDAQGAPLLNLGADRRSDNQPQASPRRVRGPAALRRRRVSRGIIAASDGTAVAVDGRGARLGPNVHAGDGRDELQAVRRGSVDHDSREFVARLEPNDQVGLFAFPAGAEVSADPGPFGGGERAPARHWPAHGTGRRQPLRTDASQHRRLSSPQAEQHVLYQRDASSIEVRLMGQICDDVDETRPQCERNVMTEVRNLAMMYKRARPRRALVRCARCWRNWAAAGRKTVVLLSAGILTGDRPGSRPDVDEIGESMGSKRRAPTARSIRYSWIRDVRM